MSLLDGLTGDAATMIDAARRLQSVAAVAHDLIEQARRELDLVQYEGPAAEADREHVAQVAASTHRLGNALNEVSAAVFRVAASLSLP
jgi:HD superfamily phosphodiesterase